MHIKIGDKVSKDDLLITLKSDSDSKKETVKQINEKIPPTTEKIIQEAEKTLILKNELENSKTKDANKEEANRIEIIKNGDIDPTETKEWMESLSAVLEKDGKQRAFLFFI